MMLVMNQSSLEQLLQQRREKSAARLPSSFAQNVWREIRHRKFKDIVNPHVFWGWLLKPQVILATLTLAMTVGIGLGSRNHLSQADQTHDALDLGVFGKSAPALPSTLLASNL